MYGNPVNSGTVINLFSSALLLANDEKYLYGNPINNDTVVNFLFFGLNLSSRREIYVW